MTDLDDVIRYYEGYDTIEAPLPYRRVFLPDLDDDVPDTIPGAQWIADVRESGAGRDRA